MFKKISFGLMLATAFVACDGDDYTDWGNPQSNGPEDQIVATFNLSAVDAIDLASVQGDSVQVFVPAITVSQDYAVSYEVAAANTDGTANTTLVADSQGRVSVEALQSAVEILYGKRPVQRTLISTVNAYALVNGAAVKKSVSTPFNILATPVAPVIEEAYYLIGDGQELGWDYAAAIAHKFNHSGADVYDDPVFTITVPAPYNEDGTRANFYYKVVPASALASGDIDWNGVLGSDTGDGDDRKEAGLAVSADAFCQYAADEAKCYSITLNMMDYKLTIEPFTFEEWIYMPGSPQNWTFTEAPALQSPNFDGIYTGYGYLDGEFKFTKATDWSHGEYNYGSFTSYSEGFTGEGTGNINFTGEPGYYKITANVVAGSLEAVKTDWAIIGPAQEGGWTTDTEMTYNLAEDCWEVTLAMAADEYKFRANGEWDIDFGGTEDDLKAGGGNLRVAEAGTYTVKLYLSCSNGHTKRYCTLTKVAAAKRK